MVAIVRMVVLIAESLVAQLAQWTGAGAFALALLSGWLGGRLWGVLGVAMLGAVVAHVYGAPVGGPDKVAGASDNPVFLFLIYGLIAVVGSLAGAFARAAARRNRG